MKYILLIIFAIVIYSIGSYLGSNTINDSIEEQRNFRVENVETSKDYRKNSASKAYEKRGYIGKVETRNNVSKNFKVSGFDSKANQDSTFELIFFLCSFVFTGFLVILHFYGYNEKARKYQRFDRALRKQRQIIDRQLSTQSCDS